MNCNYPRAALYDTDGNQVSGSIIISPSPSHQQYIKVRSGSLTLTDDTDYTVRIANPQGGCHTYIRSARLIVVQSDTTKLSNTQTQIEVGDHQAAFTNETYSNLTDEKIYLYDEGQFSPAPTASFSASLKIDNSGDTVYAEPVSYTHLTLPTILLV